MRPGDIPEFEVFRHRIVSAAVEPSVTIQQRGILSLNAEAHQLLGTPDAVELMYDASRRVVGIRAASAEVPHSYPLRAVGGPDGRMVVSATAFLRFFGIELDRSRRWPAELDDGVLTIDLRGDGIVVTSNRASARSRRAQPGRPSGQAREG